MKSSTQLEQETDEARARVNNTLEELRARTTPGQLVDQLIDYARDSSGGAFFDNLSRQVVNNPVPIVLLGTSLAWLAFGPPRASTRAGATPERRARDLGRSARGAMAKTREMANDLVDSAVATANDAGAMAQSASDAVEQIRGRASDTVEASRERASDAYDSAAQSARRATASVGTATTKAGQNVAALSRGFVALCKEQPILVAGIGLALGATLGSLLPGTMAENRLMGAASDDVKSRARRLSGKVKESAHSVYSETKEAAGTVMESQENRIAASVALGHS